ncbi:MAG: hypothetical protein JRJ73_14155 [Deltaproteobacteria bacterium]|nr:hypothetical protein [Deltaproteobacteria bacterium]
MNRRYLLDSLDGLKALVFRLLPIEVTISIAYVPMTTDGPWTDTEKAVFETAIGIPGERAYWTPGNFVNVPPSRDPVARSKWVDAVAAINHRYLFLDPDTDFYTHHNGKSEKKVLITELAVMLVSREALVVYRHRYWPSIDEVPAHVYPYVWHGLGILRKAGFATFAYQSQAASFFFISKQESALAPFQNGLQGAFAGVSAAVVERRLVG